jgi:CHAP domain
VTAREIIVKDLIETARSQVGTARRPINNVKYNTSYYAREVSGEEYKWCVVFIWWCMQKCNVPMSVFPKSASVFAVRDWYKERHRFFPVPTTPMTGDLVIYSYSHIGIVAQLLPDNKILTIEGNLDDAVRKVEHRRSEPSIEGYCRPAYHMVQEVDVTEAELRKVVSEEITRVLDHEARKVFGITSWDKYLEALLEAARKN